jgi:predicted transcriptional regulator of viral defense system
MDWYHLASAQHGVITREQLRSFGLYDQLITSLLDRREVWTVLQGVFLVRGAPLTYAARLWAATLRINGVVGFESAGHMWGQLTVQPKQVHICVANPVRSHAAPWIKLHRVDVPPWARTT